MRTDGGLRFWLDYVEAAGGLWEDTGDSTVVVLPEALRQDFGGTDHLEVTGDPDVAREEGVTLLAAGHPYLMHASQAVLDGGDCGVVRLPRSPTGKLPDTRQLEAWARERFPVDHGRIDAREGAAPGIRHVARVGALVTYAVSADDHFQERVECWADVPSRLAIPEDVVARLSNLLHGADRDGGPGLPDPEELIAALSYADEQIGARTCTREAELSAQFGDVCARETQRAVTYYEEALRSLQRRLDSASAERAATLSARMSGTRAERDRRLAEIAEKYRGHTTIKPFRLHVVTVPVLRLPVDVRRGGRRFPLVLDWLPAARTFAGLRCPQCASTEPLVAAKTRLGCRQCLVKPDASRPTDRTHAPAPADAPPTPQPPAEVAKSHRPRSAAPAGKPARAGSTASTGQRARNSGGRPTVRPAPAASPRAIEKAGSKLVTSLWDLTATGDRRVRRLYAPGSPAAAMQELFGPGAPLRVLGVAPLDQPLATRAVESEPSRPDPRTLIVAGELDCTSTTYPFQLIWRFSGATPLIVELTPFARAGWPSMPQFFHRLFAPGADRLFETTPEPRAELDPVARALWRRGVPTRGVPLVVRCLAAWWRIDDRAVLLEAHPRSVLAAAIDRMIAYRAGSSRGTRYADVAATYQVDADAVRAATTALQRRLQLSPVQPW